LRRAENPAHGGVAVKHAANLERQTARLEAAPQFCERGEAIAAGFGHVNRQVAAHSERIFSAACSWLTLSWQF
jgi:hypothetical protein